MIEIYGKEQCGYCDMAKKLCESKNLEYNYYQLNREFTRDEMMKMFPDAKSFPQVRIDERHIGGYKELWTIYE